MPLLLKRMIMIVGLCLFMTSMLSAEMIGRPEGRISDYSKLLSDEVRFSIQGLIDQVEQRTGAQLAVVTVKTLDGLSVEEYANTLFNRWGIGQKGKDNGVLFLIAGKEHKVRIEVGYGLEHVINDGKAGRILDEAVLPYFKSNDYDRGILNGVQYIAATILDDKTILINLEPPPTSAQPELSWKEKILIIGFFGLFVIIGFLMLGTGLRGDKFLAFWGAGFGGIPLAMSVVFAFAMGFPVYILPMLAGVMFITGMIFGKKILKSMSSSGRGGKGSSHGSSGSSSFGGSSGRSSSSSGFGGGSSGGGGSSRSW